MTLLDDGKVMVRVALNELQPKSLNPNVPYGPAEVAADAITCGRAGAAIAHVHSRHDDGSQALDDDSAGAGIYRRILELVGRESDIIVEPTNFPRGQDPTSAADVPQIWALLERPPTGTRLEIVNIDGFRFGRAGWDQATQTAYGVDRRDPDRDRPYPGPEVVQRVLRSGLVPFFGVFDLRDTRMLAAMAHGGAVPEPVLVQINFFFDLITGPTPSVEALDAILCEWRRLQVDAELSVFVRMAPDMMFYETFLDAALERGVHPRVGLGDNPHLFSSNAEMVDHAVELASRRGFTPATPADVRQRVGILHPTRT
jgi:uncharacterized protein (DUF849 family)